MVLQKLRIVPINKMLIFENLLGGASPYPVFTHGVGAPKEPFLPQVFLHKEYTAS